MPVSNNNPLAVQSTPVDHGQEMNIQGQENPLKEVLDGANENHDEFDTTYQFKSTHSAFKTDSLPPQNEAPKVMLSAADTDALNNLSNDLAGVMSSGATSVSDGLFSRWSELIAKVGVDKGAMVDVNALVQMVLREAYMENTQDLHFYAQKVKYFNEVKKSVRKKMTDLREILSQQAGRNGEDRLVKDKDANPLEYLTINIETFNGDFSMNWQEGENSVLGPKLDEDGNPMSASTKDELDTYITNLEETLNGVGDDAQLANVDLQNMLQKQQQTLQMLSNISKMLHDTAMAVIRKIGG